MKEDGTVVLNCVAVQDAVVGGTVRVEAFQRMVANPASTSHIKPLPLTVRVNPGPPAVAEVGLMLVIVGGGNCASAIGAHKITMSNATAELRHCNKSTPYFPILVRV